MDRWMALSRQMQTAVVIFLADFFLQFSQKESQNTYEPLVSYCFEQMRMQPYRLIYTRKE